MSKCVLCKATKNKNDPLTWIVTCDMHLRDECYSCYRKMHTPIPYFEDEVRKKRASGTTEEYDVVEADTLTN